MATELQGIQDLPEDSESLRLMIAELLAAKAELTDEARLWMADKAKLESQAKLLLTHNAELAGSAKLLEAQNKHLSDEITVLREQLALLKAKQYGKSSEKVAKRIEELELHIEEKETAIEAATSVKAVEESKNKPKRLKLPENLMRTEVTIPAPATCDDCGSVEFRNISNDVSEILEYVPSSFRVIKHIRPRCACTNCEKIVQGYAPGNTIDKGKAGPGMLAHIIVQKYCNHLPLYRQSQIYSREGIELARSTMAGWVGQCARLIEPLLEELRKYVFASSHLHGDDTPVKVLAPGAGKTITARIWTYVKDGRSYKANEPPAICYYYSPDRKGERPAEHLKHFAGVLHADAYAGYNKIYGDTITEAACWAHTRRKFYEVTVASDNANIATEAVEQIDKIYAIEGEIKGLEPEERLKYRQEHSKELVEKFFITIKKYYDKLPKKSMTAKAITYALNNEVALKCFLEDGKIQVDNNAAERAMRGIALGRKNWLFAGSDSGGETAAAFYSLIETAKLNDINPWQYLKAVLARIQDHNSTKIAELLPWNIVLE
jgi:transposase